MASFSNFIIPPEELYEKAELTFLKRTSMDISTLEKKINYEDVNFVNLIPETKELILQKCLEEPTKGLIRTAGFLINDIHFRKIVLKKLDTWLQAIALQRCAPEIILFICCNVNDFTIDSNIETIRDLFMLFSLQKKQHQTVFLACLDKWLINDKKNIEVFISIILDHEFSPKQRMAHLYMIMQFLYSKTIDETSKLIANRISRELIKPKGVKAVRNFFKEFSKTGFKVDFQFGLMTKYIFESVKITINQQELFNDDFNAGDLIKNTVYLCSIMPIMAMSTGMKDAGNVRRSGGVLNMNQSGSLNRFHIQIQQFMISSAEFLRWASTISTNKINENSFVEFYDILYYNSSHTKILTFNDGWPTEFELAAGVKMIQECIIDEQVISALLNPPDITSVDISKGRILVTPNHIVELLEKLTQRLLNFKPIYSEQSLLNIKSVKILEQLFNLSNVSNYLQFITVDGIKESQIGIKNVYIKCWKLAINWTLMCRKNLLKEAYETFPTMKMALHMAMTRSDFPILRFENKTQSELISNDQKAIKKENEIISKFFSKLKEKSIQFAYHNHQDDLCLIKPKECPRSFVVDYHLCKSKDIGPILCSIRDPDILKNLANDDLADLARSSVHDAIAKNSNLIHELPILTIANLYLEDTNNADTDQVLSIIKTRLMETLQKSGEEEKEIVHFLISKLCADLSEDRKSALNAVQCLIGDKSTEEKKIEALKNLPSFDIYSDFICKKLSQAIMIESDMERIYTFIGFITNHVNKESEISHVVALRLTNVIERVESNSDSIAHQKVQDSLTEFFAKYLKSASEGNQPLFDNKEDFGQPYKVKLPKIEKEFILSSKILTGMMNLLCDSGAGNQDKLNPNKEYLLSALFGDGTDKLSVINASDGSKVEVLPEDLRRRMLSSFDERVIKAALSGITVERALQFLQSFAINSVAYSQLLALVNASDIPPDEARKAAVFVRAYKLRGAKGAEEFLEKINYTQETPMDVDVKNKDLDIDPKPVITLTRRKSINTSNINMNTSTAVLNYLKKVITSDVNATKLVTTDEWMIYSKVISNNEEIASEVANFISKLSDENVHFSIRLTVLSLISQISLNSNYQQIVVKLANTKIGQMPQFKLVISNFVNKSDVEVKRQQKTPNEILSELANNKLDQHHVNGLLHLFYKIRPEIIDTTADENTISEQIISVFKTKSWAIMKVIELLAANTLPLTVKIVVNFLLKQFELSVSPGLVIEFIEKCVKSPEESRKIVPTAEQSIILIDYVIANMTFESPTNSVVPQFLAILEALMETHGDDAFEKVLKAISKKLDEALIPPMDEPHYLILNKLLDALSEKFCGCREKVEAYQQNLGLIQKIIVPQNLFNVHQQVCFAITEMKDATYSGDEKRIKTAHDKLFELAESNPKVVGSHIQMITNRVNPVLSMIKKEYKENHFIKFLEQALEIVLKSSPYSMKDSRALDQFLKIYILFFRNRIIISQRFIQLFYLLVDTCLEYTIQNPKAAQNFLINDENIFVSMLDNYKDYTPLISLVRQMKNY